MKSKIKLRNGEQEVLVEKVKYKLWSSDVVQSSMMKNQIPKMLKLIYSKIWILRSHHSFFTNNSNTNIRLQNHRHIISPITNAQSCFCRIIFLYHSAKICSLLRRNTASNDRFTCFCNWNKAVFELFIWWNFSHCCCFSDQSSFFMFFHQLIVELDLLKGEEFFCLLLCGDFIDDHIFCQKFARKSNVSSSLQLISCQHPNFNPCLMKRLYCILNIILQSILNTCCTYQCKISFKSIKKLIESLLPFLTISYFFMNCIDCIFELIKFLLVDYSHSH